MRSERGQASVEWIGVLLLVALSLGALVRPAARSEAGGDALGATLAQTWRTGVERAAHARLPEDRPARPRAVVAPPLVPVVPGERRASRGSRQRLIPRLVRGPGARGVRRAGGVLWRRAWLLCLGYERGRYEFIHPETRLPGHNASPREVIRIANDCLSPVDLVRDLEALTAPAPR
jgi:hypothetical protein